MSETDRITVQAALIPATQALAAAGIPGAGRDARLLMAHALGLAPDRLTLVLRDPLDPGAKAAFAAALARRLAREPVSHILGYREFHGHRFEVGRDVLDPRPETEILVAEALSRPFASVLDLGTGSGAILLSLLAERPRAMGLGTDLSEAALAVARRNAAALDLGARARFRRADWWQGVDGVFDLIVSNPPYISAAEMAGLAPELSHEPRGALTDEADGLSAYREIARQAGAFLAPGGRIALEIGPTQGSAVAGLLLAQGFRSVRVIPDLDGRDRVVRADAPEPAPAS
ncbi:peptide chain release factor N(5)-glutamine methyltransferase [Celeribacter indicus]|uniref:Release factor glutamine methyltransferase n=1 Tax=Celeribacter indicus TaxID=1208324 RepID=A0A0B5E2X6_9RHOB|nr:peptide chain release factor N(5)-glutamine methyltransferase [Celeribacter indicus]AJE47381.1 N5-glutamine S-adenosyl-L-methionine-dependent methyltransferase [Celeribacter indicus]SDW05076.1 [protein release factor]-glutamine N5-methyltransferase [Celeribacter indicus]